VRKLGFVLSWGFVATALAAGSVGGRTAVALAEPVRAEGVWQDAGTPTTATMTCERVDSPGRVRCDVEARVAAGESIAWGDIVIVRTPPFVGALRGRIGPDGATAREAQSWRWALALVARAKGSGDVDARVRLVVCRGDRCGPRQVELAGHVAVGE
jgi:hypothetical protein